MKNTILIPAMVICLWGLLQRQDVHAQTKEYKVVFDLTSGDTTDHQSVVRWLKGISGGNPNAQLEVVFYGQSLPMVLSAKSTVAADIQSLATNKNISFRVCEMAMKRHKLSPAELIPGVQTVPDGIGEIVQKQKEGWGYIKAGR